MSGMQVSLPLRVLRVRRLFLWLFRGALEWSVSEELLMWRWRRGVRVTECAEEAAVSLARFGGKAAMAGGGPLARRRVHGMACMGCAWLRGSSCISLGSMRTAYSGGVLAAASLVVCGVRAAARLLFVLLLLVGMRRMGHA